MTLDEIRKSNKPFLIPTDISEVLGCDPHLIRIEAKNGTLPFEYVRLGSRTKISREGFLSWIDGGKRGAK